MQTAGVVLDCWDDQGAMLPEMVPQDAIPEYVKEAAVLDPAGAAQLPPAHFALAAVDGDTIIKKYAMVDAGNVWLSTKYFMHQRGYLPKVAQAQVAGRLLQGHQAYGLTPPDDLVALALHLGDDVDKCAGVMIDVTGAEPATAVVHEEVADDHMILGEYPVRTYEEVKLAAAFFDENLPRLHPRVRREFAVKLASRADDLGIKLEDPRLHKYASSEVAPDAAAFIMARKDYLPADFQPALEKIAEGLSAQGPEVVAEALCTLDESTGLAHLWDKHVIDPYYGTFGAVKTAEEYVYNEGAEHCTETDLVRLSGNRALVVETFGDEFASEFAKDPVAVFKSMPDDTKLILARMAADNFSAGDRPA